MPPSTPPPSSTPATGDPHVSYMTKEQLSAYLSDLRTNRPSRPAGSRPLPPSTYQQKRAAAAAAAAAASTTSPSTSPAKSSPLSNTSPPRTADHRRRDSHRRSRTNPSVSFASHTTEYPPEPAQTPTVTGLEEDVSDLSISGGSSTDVRGGVHRKTRSIASIDSQSTIELLRADTPPVAPLKINKINPSSSSNNTTPVRNSSSATMRSGYVPNPSRYVYNHPNQFSKPQYTTNPVPLPSPPPEIEDDGRGIGTREERGRPPVPTIKVQRDKPKEPPVIAIVDAPVENTGRGTGRSATPPGVPSINVTPIPTISFPDEEDTKGKRSSPSINVPGISISVEDTSTSRSPPRTAPPPSAYQQQQQSRRPLPTPTPNASPFRKTPSTYSTTGRPSAACTTCYQHISGRIVSALGSRFHPECFRCHHCREKLEHVGFFPEPEKNRAARAQAVGARVEDMDKRFFCHLDFHELFSPRCKNCQTPIEGEVVVACGETWHVGHFFCAECGDPFTADTKFVEKDKYAWCLSCYNKRYSSKCRKCKKPVTDTVVKAMGGEWHVECFCCAIGEKAIRKCFGPHSSSSGTASSSNPTTSSPLSPTEGRATKVTKPKERGLRKARSVIGLGRRPSVDSGYGGDVEKSVLPNVTDTLNELPTSSPNQSTPLSTPLSTPQSTPQSTPRREYMTMPRMTSPPKPESSAGSLLRRFRSTRLSFRSSTPTAASVFASPPPNPILESVNGKETGYSTDTLPTRSGTPLPPRSGTPLPPSRSGTPLPPSRSGTPLPPPRSGTPVSPPMMRKLVAGLLERRGTIRMNGPPTAAPVRSAQPA